DSSGTTRRLGDIGAGARPAPSRYTYRRSSPDSGRSILPGARVTPGGCTASSRRSLVQRTGGYAGSSAADGCIKGAQGANTDSREAERAGRWVATMKCTHVQDRLVLYLAKELSPRENGKITNHVTH